MSLTLEPVFEPKNVAVIGASAMPGRSGYFFTKQLLECGFTGKVYPINPKGGDIDGYPMYKNLDEIGAPIDLALFLVNKKNILQSIADCAAHGVKAGVIYTAGFAEMGEEGLKIQKEMVEIANASGMRLIGPNCMGIFSDSCHLNLVGEPIPSGDIGLISQSGNIAWTLWHDAVKYLETGFSRFVGFGNQADIFMHEYLEYFMDDPKTKVIAIYVEGLRADSGMDFIRVAAEAAKKKPVVIMKGGRSNAGRRAATSHTGSLAGNDVLYSTSFKKAGIIEVKRLEELLPVAQALLLCPSFKGNDLAIAGSGGGHMIVCTDCAEEYGFNVPPFSQEASDKIAVQLYDFAPKGNPFDQAGSFIDDLDVWSKTTSIAMSETNIGGTFIFGNLGGYMPALVSGGINWNTAMFNLAKVQKETKKPIVAYSVSARDNFECNHILRREGIPVFDSPDIAMRAMKALREREEYLMRSLEIPEIKRRNSEVPESFVVAAGRADKNLTESEAYDFLTVNGIPVTEWRLAHNQEEAAVFAAQIGYPVVMKVVSPKIIHKSDFGGVKVGLDDREAVIKAYDDIVASCKEKAPDADLHGVLIAKQSQGVEIIAGLISDKQFGPTLMIGLGGVFVEIMKDVDFCILPASREEIRDKMKGLKGYPLLTGIRGQKKVDVEALIGLLYKLANLACQYPEIVEMDLNPILVGVQRAVVADARIIIK